MKPRPTPTGFDRIIVVVCTGLVLLFGAVSLAGCRSVENVLALEAAENRAKAKKLIAKAVLADPSIMVPEVRVDTVIKWTTPTAISVGRMYSQSSIDSLATMCSDLLSVYRGEAEAATRKYAELQREKMRRNLCTTEPLDTLDGPCAIRVWADAGGIHVVHNKMPERVESVVETATLTIDTEAPKDEPKTRVKSVFWMCVPWTFGALVLGFFLGLFIRGGNKHQDYTPHLKNPME